MGECWGHCPRGLQPLGPGKGSAKSMAEWEGGGSMGVYIGRVQVVSSRSWLRAVPGAESGQGGEQGAGVSGAAQPWSDGPGWEVGGGCAPPVLRVGGGGTEG